MSFCRGFVRGQLVTFSPVYEERAAHGNEEGEQASSEWQTHNSHTKAIRPEKHKGDRPSDQRSKGEQDGHINVSLSTAQLTELGSNQR